MTNDFNCCKQEPNANTQEAREPLFVEGPGPNVTTPPAPKPTLGRIVHYRGKQGLLTGRAAIVTCDVNSLDRRGVDSGDIPDLDSDEHVHLWVFTPGEAAGFTEYNVPRGEAVDGEETTYGTIPPGTWCWPPRV